MKVNPRIVQIMIAIEIGMVLMNVLIAQSSPKEYTIPTGWEETEAWLPKFQAAFGTDANYGEFFSIMSESDFLLTNPEHQAFIFVWQEVVDSRPAIKNLSGNNKFISLVSNQSRIEEVSPQISISGMIDQELAMTRQIILHPASSKAKINVLIISPRKSNFDLYHSNILHEIANSWNPFPNLITDTNQVCTPTACSDKDLK